jgi:hypothetical protein
VVSSHSGTPLGVGTSHGHFGPRNTPRPGLGEATTFPHIVFSTPPRRGYIQMALFPRTPKLESRNCPKTVPGGVPGGVPRLWEVITPDFQVWSRRGINQTCSPRWDLSNDVSRSQFGGQFGGREEVDSRLFVVRSQTASLTPDPSFAHNLCYRCPNDQCEAIFDIFASRHFQRHQEHPNARCFGRCCRALNIRESRRTPNPHFFQVLGFTPTLGQSKVATNDVLYTLNITQKKNLYIKEFHLVAPSNLVITFASLRMINRS